MEYDTQGLAEASDQTKLFYGVRGSGEPTLLLLDGIGCDGWAWNHIQPHLAANNRVVHLHYRGHGRSGAPAHPDHNGIEELADDTLRVMDTLGIESAIPVGHSMGTQVALEIIRHHPERVAALILVCGSHGRITHTFHGNDFLHRALPTLIDNVRRRRGLFRALWGRLPSQLSYRVAGWLGEIDGALLDPNDFRQYVEHLSDIDLDLYLTMLQKAGDHSAEDVLPTVSVPSLVIAAEKDMFTPVETARLMGETIPGAQYLEMAGASHAGPLEQPALINETISTFLRTLSS